MKEDRSQKLVIFQSKTGKIEFRGDFEHDTIWATQKQIADVFGVDRSVATRHINKVFKDGEVEVKRNVQKMHIANSDKPVKLYSLDIILAVGYRTNSAQAIAFRRWATDVLKKHIVDGFTINKTQVGQNYEKFLLAISDVRALLPSGNKVKARDILELMNAFASTWFSLDAYDKDTLPKGGVTKKKVVIASGELEGALAEFKQGLIANKQATEIFGQDRGSGGIEGIVGNVFQSLGGKDVYPSAEEKAANLLYFVVKNHPFVDGNKRSGAFAFIWFLRKGGILRASLTPEALTVLTLLIAESDPREKDKMVGLVMLILKK